MMLNDERIMVYFKIKMLVNDSKMLVKDGEMLVVDGEMSIWSYTYFTIINKHLTIIS